MGELRVEVTLTPREVIESSFVKQLLHDLEPEGDDMISRQELDHIVELLRLDLSQADVDLVWSFADADQSGLVRRMF